MFQDEKFYRFVRQKSLKVKFTKSSFSIQEKLSFRQHSTLFFHLLERRLMKGIVLTLLCLRDELESFFFPFRLRKLLKKKKLLRGFSFKDLISNISMLFFLPEFSSFFLFPVSIQKKKRIFIDASVKLLLGIKEMTFEENKRIILKRF